MNSNNTAPLHLVGKKGIFYPCSSLPENSLRKELEAHIDELVSRAKSAVTSMIEASVEDEISDKWENDSMSDEASYIINNKIEFKDIDNLLEIISIDSNEFNIYGDVIFEIWVCDFTNRVWEVCFETEGKISEWGVYCVEGWFTRDEFCH